MLHNFGSTQTPLLTDVSNIDKEDGADIKVEHLPISPLLFQQRFTSSAFPVLGSWCQLLQVPPCSAREEEASVLTLPSSETSYILLIRINYGWGENVSGRENIRKETKTRIIAQ